MIGLSCSGSIDGDQDPWIHCGNYSFVQAPDHSSREEAMIFGSNAGKAREAARI
jgi:hypothetical protein